MEGINKSGGASQVYKAQGGLEQGLSLMSPEDILAYVGKTLGDIGNQLQDYKDLVQKRQEKANDLRDVTSTLRDMQSGGDLTAFDPQLYSEFMQKMEKYKDSDPAIGAAYEKFMSSYGGYIGSDGKAKGVMAGANAGDTQDMKMSALELSHAMKDLEGAQEAMGSDNELTMMALQQLMQRRNQVSQFASNAMNMMNEGMKSIIGNIR